MNKTDAEKDYYFIARCIDSCTNSIQLKQCNILIELYDKKHLDKLNIFKKNDLLIFNDIVKRQRELLKYVKRKIISLK